MDGVSIAFLDSLNTFKGWSTIFNKPGAWVQYNSVDFGNKPFKTITANVRAVNGGVLQVRINSSDGPLITEITIPKSNEWKLIQAQVMKYQTGIKNLFVVLKDGTQTETDWISFK
jgi:hypothetical protein